ncbi:hypothetical protein LTR10_023344 [Elasticomyces elasticus]|uniref:NB-ARC domain-containing protein n=1 Tax=Exophiala sideris TaxID=1016849 RepID=A0ABR0IVD3_9EURO|nr:hypothetical protein LTR10_023344 [Elasticomyces elasticus]KAK5048772.1 hypothetical protein LTR69_011271 [Exophiala sideris]
MTFGYNADAAFGQSTAKITDHAKSLLIGLADEREAPEALFQARLESRYQSIKDATVGLIFMGTPHHGSDTASYGKVLANAAQFLSHRPPPRLLAALQTYSDVLLRLTTDFRFQLPDYKVYSFFESRPMKGLSGLTVEKHSALLETNHEEHIPVDADHSAMCKFETQDDDTFKRVYKRIERLKNNQFTARGSRAVGYVLVINGQQKSLLRLNEILVSHNQHFQVPHLLSPVFTGRDDDMQSLTAAFVPVPPSQRPHQRRFVLFGLGGSGKTQICLKHVQDQRERYWGIFWIDASTDESIQQPCTQRRRAEAITEPFVFRRHTDQ